MLRAKGKSNLSFFRMTKKCTNIEVLLSIFVLFFFFVLLGPWWWNRMVHRTLSSCNMTLFNYHYLVIQLRFPYFLIIRMKTWCFDSVVNFISSDSDEKLSYYSLPNLDRRERKENFITWPFKLFIINCPMFITYLILYCMYTYYFFTFSESIVNMHKNC